MAEQFVLSKRDYERFQAVLRWAERNKNLHPEYRRRHVRPINLHYQIFKVQSEATGDGVYTCHVQKLLNAEWEDEDGDSKVVDKDAVEVEVLNLAEFDPEATYVAHLTAGDLIVAWRMMDDEGTSRWVGIPFRQANADRCRKAFCKENAPGDATIECYLDEDDSDTVINVHCNISGGSALDKSIRRLKDGDMILVEKIGATWYCIEGFQTIDETKGLHITGDKLAVNINTTELRFDSGAIETKLDECPLG